MILNNNVSFDDLVVPLKKRNYRVEILNKKILILRLNTFERIIFSFGIIFLIKKIILLHKRKILFLNMKINYPLICFIFFIPFFIAFFNPFFYLIEDLPKMIDALKILFPLYFFSIFLLYLFLKNEIKNDIKKSIEEISSNKGHIHPWDMKSDFTIKKHIDRKKRTIEQLYDFIKKDKEYEYVLTGKNLYLKIGDSNSYQGFDSLKISQNNEFFLFTFNFSIKRLFLRNSYAVLRMFILIVLFCSHILISGEKDIFWNKFNLLLMCPFVFSLWNITRTILSYWYIEDEMKDSIKLI